jgi:HK97 family phage portal protein
MRLFERWRKKPETRAFTSWDLLQAGHLGIPYVHSQHLVENLSTVSACVSLISSSIASLPAYVYQNQGNTKVALPDHPLQQLVDQGPNKRQSWFDFVQSLLADVLLSGNSLAAISRDGRGQVTRLEYCPWRTVSPQLLNSGRLRFDVAPTPPGAMPRRLLDGEVLHLKDRSDDGYLGRSRLSRAAQTVSLGLSMEHFANSTYRNGVRPSGVLETPQQLAPEARQHLRESVEALHAGPSGAGRFMLLEAGVLWKQMSLSLEDAEVLGSRKFQVEELCRLYDTPPPLVGHLEATTLANVESLLRVFLNLCLAPWITRIEQTVTRSVLVEPSVRFEMDTSGFLRGDALSRWQAWQIALVTQTLVPNEVRQAEGWNPRPGGDEVLRMPGQV